MKLPQLVLSTLVFLSLFVTVSFSQFSIELTPIGRYTTGLFDEGGSEIVAYDFKKKRLFSINSGANTVDVIDLHNPSSPTLLFSIDMSPYGGGANSVDVYNGLVAVAVQNDDKQLPGKVVVFNNNGEYLSDVEVGALPDMLTFTHNGKYILVANEGEPNSDYTVDPEGSVSIIEVKHNGRHLKVTNVDFRKYNGYEDHLRRKGIRIFGPNASASQDFEPEYIAISDDDKKAYVTLQENNAIIIIDIKHKKIESLEPLGYKNHNLSWNGLDASDKDDAINITNWPVYGMYQPDGIAYFKVGGKGYLVTANEGDAREYGDFVEEERVKDLALDSTAFPNADFLQKNENLGRLTITNTLGDKDNDGDFDKLYVLGGRSFSIWDTKVRQVFDSGDELEKITASASPDDFNSNNDENDSFDSRSDNKGPEPEGVVIAKMLNRYFAFIGLERIGGVMVYDVTNPKHPKFVQYVNTRDFTGDAELGTAGDLGPEGLFYIPYYKSPNHKPLLIVGNEVSGSVVVYEINPGNGYNKLYAGGDESEDMEYQASLLTADEEEGEEVNSHIATDYTLMQNYPNPFNPTTNISFAIANAGFVTLKVYDILGKEVAVLVNENLDKGLHKATLNGNDLASGVYIYRLQADNFVDTKRFILMK